MKLLADIHERNAILASDSAAVVFEDRTQTFGEYWSRINRIAHGIYQRGARHQDRVALLSMNRLEYTEVYGACERAGFIMTTVNFRLSAPEIEYVFRDSAPHTLVFEDQYAVASLMRWKWPDWLVSGVVMVARLRLRGQRAWDRPASRRASATRPPCA